MKKPFRRTNDPLRKVSAQRECQNINLEIAGRASENKENGTFVIFWIGALKT